MLSKEYLINTYINNKLSSVEIAEKLKCSSSKVDYWLAKHGIKKRGIKEAVYLRLNPNGDPFSYNTELINKAPFLFGLGMGLYWGEGTKANKSSVRLGNTDPDLILYFIKFLKEVFEIKESKMNFGLQLFEDIDPKKAMSFWVKKLSVKSSQFYKPIVSRSLSKGTYSKKSKYGVLTVYVSNVKLKKIFDHELEQLRKKV